ncbi:hypothetical protein [Desulfobotulus alkaliphilus]|uniref:hypothetical protein n=1 Tax=Desulfobotulus alkaliphilus TaxID=622671 RepID=UPI001C9692B8|nr:hypothetical protein [Desulfobotulus alkaliphilus]
MNKKHQQTLYESPESGLCPFGAFYLTKQNSKTIHRPLPPPEIFSISFSPFFLNRPAAPSLSGTKTNQATENKNKKNMASNLLFF